MKKETLQLIPRKYKRIQEATMNDYMPTNWATYKKWKIIRNIQLTQTKSGKNRKSE